MIKIGVKEAWKKPKKTKPEKAHVKTDSNGFDHEHITDVCENAIADILGVEINKGDGYDLIYKGLKIDVVAQSYQPEKQVSQIGDAYTGGLTPEQYDKHQNCDVYVFVRHNTGEENIWVGGWIKRDDFYALCKFRAKDTNIGCITVKYDGHQIRFKQLKPFTELEGIAVD